MAVRVQAEGGTRTLTRVPIGLLEPVRAAEALFEFARGRLERLELPAPARALALPAEQVLLADRVAHVHRLREYRKVRYPLHRRNTRQLQE